MTKIFKYLKYTIFSVMGIILLYFIFALLLTEISVNGTRNTKPTHKIYLNTNGIHLDIVLSVENIDQKILHQLPKKQNTQYVSLGWGDKNFYLNTPEWKDLTTRNAVNALFLNSKSLIHIYQYPRLEKEWVEVPLDKTQLETLNRYILNSFETDTIGNIQLLKGKDTTHL